MRNSIPIVAIVGPTCTGKTWLSLRLAEQLGTEIIACDSRTIYRYMDIGTAKPTVGEQSLIKHHLLDIIDPDETYTVARYKDDAEPIIENLRQSGLKPIVCGGTGFYFRNLLEGLSIPAVPPQSELRRQLNLVGDNQGNEVLYAKLSALDPAAAERINVNDRFRLVRALEVSMVLSKPFSEAVAKHEPRYEVIWIGLHCHDRNILRQLIDKRLAEQLELGLVEEVKGIIDRYGICQSLLDTVAYRETVQFLQNEISSQQAMELSAKHTYQLARRQLMWFRSNKKIKWFAIDQTDRDQILLDVLSLIREFDARDF